jgi:hypothetical protein
MGIVMRAYAALDSSNIVLVAKTILSVAYQKNS